MKQKEQKPVKKFGFSSSAGELFKTLSSNYELPEDVLKKQKEEKVEMKNAQAKLFAKAIAEASALSSKAEVLTKSLKNV